jgi:hypothetical protein
VVQLGGLVTMLSLGGFMFAMFRRDYRLDHHAVSDQQGTATDKQGKGTMDHPSDDDLSPRNKGERITEWITSAQYSGNFSSSG